MSDTPQTDYYTKKLRNLCDDEFVPIEFARQLERELGVWKHEADLLREQLAKADKALQDNISIFIDLREQRDSLEEALEAVLDEIGIAYLACKSEAKAVLAAVKGGKDEH